jgi:quercetin dioxygenase-like cupin family protein
MLEHELRIDRRGFLAGVAAASALAAVSPVAFARLRKENAMDIQRVGSQASIQGPEEWFTGSVRIDPLLGAKEPSRVGAASVTFEPGARTAWHTHPLGQHLIITSGFGWVQVEGGPIHEVRPGDVVWFPPGVKHWHGASPENAMTHIAIQESKDGSPVDWLEKVSDEQYRR